MLGSKLDKELENLITMSIDDMCALALSLYTSATHATTGAEFELLTEAEQRVKTVLLDRAEQR